MEHSKMYNAFIKWTDLIGTKEGDYTYPPSYLDKLYDWEHDEIETIIYEKFKEGHAHVIYFSPYMPYLKNYDGIAALKQYLVDYPEILGYVIEVAHALYEATLEPKYVGIMMDLYRKKQVHNLSYVSIISDSTPSEALFEALANIYVHDKIRVNRSTAAMGMFHCKGYIQDVNAFGETSDDEMKIRRLFGSEDIKERKRLAEKLTAGQQLIEGIPVPEPLY